jgi:hypothetical protein
VSSSHDVVEKSPGPPLVLVISSDDELEVSSSRRLVRCGGGQRSGAARLRSSAGSPIVISSEDEEEEESMSLKSPPHHYHSQSHPHLNHMGTGGGAHRSRLQRSRSRSPHGHKQHSVGPGLFRGSSGQNRVDPIIISSDSDTDFHRSRSPFKSSSRNYNRLFDGPPHHSLHYPPQHARHQPAMTPPHPLPSRYGKHSSKRRHHSSSPHGTKKPRISHYYLFNGRDSLNRRGVPVSPHRQINSSREQYVSSHSRDSRISPRGKGSVMSPTSLPNGSPSHRKTISHLHRKANGHTSHIRVTPPPSSAYVSSSKVKTEYRSPEEPRYRLPHHTFGSPPDNLPLHVPLVKQERLVRELSPTPSPPPPRSPPSPHSPIQPPPCTPPHSNISTHSPDPPSGCIPRQGPLIMTLSLKKKRRRLFTEEDGKGKREFNIKKDSETPVSKVDTERRRNSIGDRTPSHEARTSRKPSSETKRKRLGKSLFSYDSTPEISLVQKKGKRKSSVRLSGQGSSRQTRLERYFPDDRGITPPLEPNNLFSLGANHRDLVAPAMGRTPCVVLKSPVNPACGAYVSGDGSAPSGSVAYPLVSSPHSKSSTPGVKQEPHSMLQSEEDKVKPALPSSYSPLSTTSFSSDDGGTKCSRPESLPQLSVASSSCAVHKSQTPSPLLPRGVHADHRDASLSPPSVLPAGQDTAIPAWSDTELEMKGENQSVSPDLLEVGIFGVGGPSADSDFLPAPKSSWNYVVVHMDTQRHRRDNTKFVESLEEIVSKGFCIPDAQIGVVLKHIQCVSNLSRLLRLHSVLTVDASSRRSVGLSSREVWSLIEDCCRQFPSSGTPSSPPRSYPQSAHVVLLYLVSLLATDAATEQTLSPAAHWRHVRVVVDLLFEQLVRPPPPSALPDLLPLLAVLLSMCASLASRRTGCGDGAMRLARELSSRMSKLSSVQLKTDFLLLIPCHSLREKIINIHLQKEFPLPTSLLGHTPVPSDHVTLELIAATHFHRCPSRRDGSPQDLAFFLSLLFHLLHSHCSRLLGPAAAGSLSFSHRLQSPSSCSPTTATSTSHPPPSPSCTHTPSTASTSTSYPFRSPSSSHPPPTTSTNFSHPPQPSPSSSHPPSPTSTCSALSPIDLARRLEPISKEIRQLFQRLSQDEALLEEMTSPDCWFHLQLLQNIFSWEHITE